MKAPIAAVILLLAASGADAACVRPGAPPTVPNGTKADEETMKQAHDALQAYVVQLEAYKACLKQQADTASSDVGQEQALVWLAQGDAAVDYASYLAKEFSVALKQFKERSPQTQTSK
jgi:hypothetical protein